VTEQYARVEVKWSEIVQDIRDRGYSIYRIARLLGVAECTVRNWLLKDGEPGFGIGAALIRLHGDVTTATPILEEAGKEY
jgi:predicted transcriptional regulator